MNQNIFSLLNLLYPALTVAYTFVNGVVAVINPGINEVAVAFDLMTFTVDDHAFDVQGENGVLHFDRTTLGEAATRVQKLLIRRDGQHTIWNEHPVYFGTEGEDDD